MTAPSADLPPLDAARLPAGVRARFVDDVNGLRMHLLEAGHGRAGAPTLLLLHGFPELAFSWRAVMPALADAGYHVVAPDQRGYGRTTGWAGAWDDDLAPFRPAGIVRDALGLVAAMGLTHVEAVIGHDFGSPIAAWCALLRPDVFRAVVMMSAPFAGPPALGPLGAAGGGTPARAVADAVAGLAALDPPRKHYQWYYSTREADRDMREAPQGLHAFLRAYYHHKSADWPGNRPHPLAGWTALELARLPAYYVMDAALDMPATVAPHMPSPGAIAACRWLPDEALAVYAAEYARTGFQGALQWYRCATGGRFVGEQQTWAGRTIDVPALFVSGAADWGIHQKPGELEAMRTRACTDLRGVHLVEGAGHWVQQERPVETTGLLLGFLQGLRRR